MVRLSDHPLMVDDKLGSLREGSTRTAVIAVQPTPVPRQPGDCPLVPCRHHFQLSYASHGVYDATVLLRVPGARAGQPAVGLSGSIHTVLTGELQVETLATYGDSTLLRYRLLPRRFELRVSDTVDQSRLLAAELGLPVYAWRSDRGELRWLVFDDRSGETARHYVRALLALTQVVLPREAHPLPSQWRSEEADAAGRYVAEYETEPQVSDTNITRLRKRKVQYLDSGRNLQTLDRYYVAPEMSAKGSLAIELDLRSRVPLLIAGAESTTARLSGSIIGTAATEIRLTRIRSEQIAEPDRRVSIARAEAAMRRSGVVSLDAAMSPEESDRAVARTQLGTTGLDSLRSALRALDRPGVDAAAATPVFLKLRAFAVVWPDSVQALGTQLLGDPRLLSVRTLAEALSSAGNAASQAALVSALQRRFSDAESRELLISALGSLRAPSPATVRAILKEVSGTDEPMSTPLLQLGTLAHQVRAVDSSLADTIVTALLDKLARASDRPARVTVLDALGNAQADAATTALKAATTDTSDVVRAAAVYALRGISEPSPDTVLLRILLTDPSERVRRQVVAAIERRQATVAMTQGLIQALQSEHSAALRLRLVRALWEMRSVSPEVARAISAIAERDPDPDVRAAAGQLLQSLRSP